MEAGTQATDTTKEYGYLRNQIALYLYYNRGVEVGVFDLGGGRKVGIVNSRVIKDGVIGIKKLLNSPLSSPSFAYN